jgi:hypothetical protein
MHLRRITQKNVCDCDFYRQAEDFCFSHVQLIIITYSYWPNLHFLKYIWRIPWSRSSPWFPSSYHWVSPTPYLAHGNLRTWTGSKAITRSNSTFMTRSVLIRMLSTICSSVSASIFCIRLVFRKMLWKYWSKMVRRVMQSKGITQSAVIKRRHWRARSRILWSTSSSLQ